MKQLFMLFILLGICLAQEEFEVTKIDDFSTSSVSMKCTGSCFPIVTSASGPGILGGSRLVQLQSNLGTITCESTTGLEFDVTGTYNGNNYFYYQQSAQLIYDSNQYPVNPDGLGQVDLYQGGSDAFFELSFINYSPRDFWQMNITVYSGQKNCTSTFSPCTSSSKCVTFVPFSDFYGCDLTRVGAITLSLVADLTSDQSSASVILTSFEAVNEVGPMPSPSMTATPRPAYSVSNTPTPRPSASRTPSPRPTPSATPSAVPTPSATLYYVGDYNVYNGTYWANNPPCYTCQQACALIYGGVYSQYHCSTSMSEVNFQAYATSWGVVGCQTVADNYAKNSNYNCGVSGCSTSAYCEDQCNSINYCYRLQ